jgi:glutaredoxin
MSDFITDVEVESFGGCQSCGGGLWDWLYRQGVKPTHKNAQITSVREDAQARARELKPDEQSYFPMIFLNGTVVFGFKPDILQVQIDEMKEAS